MFLVNSRFPLVSATRPWLPKNGYPFFQRYGVNLPSSFNTVLSSALVCSTSPPVSVWGTVYKLELFPGTPSPPTQSNKHERYTVFVTSSRPRNINLVPIDYGFRPRLRGRLTLRGLALRRKPWTFGDRVSHPVYRYSCQHSHFRYLQHASRRAFTGLRNAPLPHQRTDVRCQISDSLAYGFCQAFQHFGYFVVLTAPNLPSFFIDITKIETVTQPNTHFVTGTNGYQDEAPKVGW